VRVLANEGGDDEYAVVPKGEVTTRFPMAQLLVKSCYHVAVEW
jgi:hypothetical protein